MSEKIVQLNEEVIKGQLKELVRGSVEETLNELLEQEAEKLTQAARYERNEARQGYRSGHYDRNLTTTSGKVREYTFPQAVELLSGGAARMPPSFHAPEPEVPKVFALPERNTNSNRVRRYLWDRGISAEVTDFCVGKGLLYESKEYHNAVFVGYDQEGEARYAALRGTWSSFKGEVPGSDKRYSFSIPAEGRSEELHLLESAIDLLSYCTLCQMFGRDWKKEQLLSLGGVVQKRTEKTLPAALEHFLSGHPETKKVFLHLDNDEAGRRAVLDITKKLQGPYEVLDAAPRGGKDVNDLLRLRLGLSRKEGALER